MVNKYDIFISYRRLDENGNISGRDQARLIAKQLELEKYHPFFDYSEIKDDEFDKVIIPAIENCKIFILVLTKNSLKRCTNSDDWVRREVETAISSGCKIINVTPDNTFNGWPQNLPLSLSKIKNIQISDIHMGSLFELSVKKLISDRIIDSIENTNNNIFQKNCITQNDDDEFVNSFEDLEDIHTAEDYYQIGLNYFHGRGIEKDKPTAIRYYLKAAKLNHNKAQRLLYNLYSQGMGVPQNKELAMYWLKESAKNNNLFSLKTLAHEFTSLGEFDKAKRCYLHLIHYYESLKETPQNQENNDDYNAGKQYYIDAITSVGELYENGQGVEKDYEKAKEYYRKALELGYKTPLLNLLDRIKAETNEEFVVSMPDLLSKNEKFEMALRYIEGTGLRQSFSNAIPLLLECSDYRNHESLKILGLCYFNGSYNRKNIEDCKINYSKAYNFLDEYFRKTNDCSISYELGILFELGLGVKKNFEKSLEFYKLAINNGDERAITHIGKMFKYGKIAERSCRKYAICTLYAFFLSHIGNSILTIDFDNYDLSYFDIFISPLDEDEDCYNYCLSILDKIHKQDDKIHRDHFLEFKKAVYQNLPIIIKQNINDFSELIEKLEHNLIKDDFDLDFYNNGIKVVDLGLSSGILWCNKNVFENELINCRYAWAETNVKDNYNWNTYFDKQNKDSGKFEYINIGLGLFGVDSDDVANLRFGRTWVIPNRKHFEELLQECEWIWCNIDGMNGYKVIGKNGNWIFLSTIDVHNEYGGYWTSSLNKKDARYADFLCFNKQQRNIKAAQRCMGMFVRPIATINVFGEPIGFSLNASIFEV